MDYETMKILGWIAAGTLLVAGYFVMRVFASWLDGSSKPKVDAEGDRRQVMRDREQLMRNRDTSTSADDVFPALDNDLDDF